MPQINTSKLIFGGFFLILGFSLLIEQFVPGLNINLFELAFPGLIIAAGLLVLANNRRNLIWGAILLCAGLAWLINNLLGWNLIQVWPLFLIGIGLLIVFGKPEKHHDGAERLEGEGVNEDVVFWGIQKRVIGKFSGGEINCIFGGAEIDLSEAEIVDGAVLDCNAIFGGITLRVPKDIDVVSNATGVFGGISDKTRSSKGKATLRITGAAIFGGVEIKD